MTAPLASILQITQANSHLLAHVAPDVFDDDIDPARLAAFVAAPLHFMAVGVVAGRVVGQIRAMVQLQPDAPPVLYIDNLGVATAYQRQGIARGLVKAALNWGAAQGCDSAWVATELDNPAALALYARCESAPMQAVAYCQIAIGK